PLWPGAVVLAVAAAATILLRERPLAFALAVAVVAVTVGFVAAKIATLAAAAPVLERRIGPVEVEARIVEVDLFPEGARILAAPREIGLERVRIRLRRGGAVPEPGDWVRVRAVLMPPPPPVMPGAYDFQRQAWFARLGAVGFAVGPAEK